jgi:trehalose 6-phosphate phosphatase
MRNVLRRLTERKWLAVYVISGRRLSELRRLVRVRGIHLLGLHGWEGRVVPPLSDGRRLIRRAKRLLDHHLPRDGQIWIEDKGLGLAVHYREADPSAVRRARSAVRKVLSIVGSHLRVIEGHKVWEFLPHEIEGKGAAARAVLSTMPAGTLSIFVGDDTTDESAFGVLRHGLTIRVGKNHLTQARFVLRNSEEVRVFLLKLEAELVHEESGCG